METLAPRTWLVRLWASPRELELKWELLDERERGIASRFAFPHLRTRYVVAHAALRTVLGEVLGRPPASLEWRTGEHGKPALVGETLEFNLSHSGDWGLIGVGYDRVLGVDIEGIHPKRATSGMIDTVSSPSEHRILSAVEPGRRAIGFFRLWVRKEATLKALGSGLTRELDTIDVPLGASVQGEPVVVRPPTRPERRLLVWDVPAPLGYVAAIVVEHDASEAPVDPRPLLAVD